ncbi:MAG: hypothetical protein A2161_04185 [Candidatus Schekmanbacteria bacterium RBG_13_48_7]|uniref:DUF3604 domain-containing protein n=1 Tax=Candidatus Schekmanbacteria bacterium RBG_13_48_7 TaxID=1817878 RepID=A0A1F7RNN4_9BACT|nr:MAG: hypothetical protein A2161_04185 [Candidatus Schekmanbacteria bacterium RBG_13_48_7]
MLKLVFIISAIQLVFSGSGYSSTGIYITPQQVFAEDYTQINIYINPEKLNIKDALNSIVFCIPQWFFSPPQITEPDQPGYFTAFLKNPDGKQEPLKVNLLEQKDFNFQVQVLKQDGLIQPDETINLIYGDKNGGGPGTRCTRGNFPFSYNNSTIIQIPVLFDSFTSIDSNSYCITTSACLEIKTKPESLRMVTPSYVIVNKPFYLNINVSDTYGYSYNDFSGSVEIEIKKLDSAGFYQFKKTIPFMYQSGSYHKIEIKLTEAGDYLFTGKSVSGSLHGTSNPVRSREFQSPDNIFWGDIHGHYQTQPYDEYFVYARDSVFLDFSSLSAKSHEWSGTNWKILNTITDKFIEDSRFITFHGFEWASTKYGHHNVYFRNEPDLLISSRNSPNVAGSEEVKYIDDIREMFRWYSGRESEILIIPHAIAGPFPMTFINDGSNLRSVLEVFSIWGDGETQDPEVNILNPPQPKQGNFWLDALLAGLPFGVTGGSDSHIGTVGNTREQTYNSGVEYVGLTAVYAEKLTREAIFDAIKNKHTYATTGPRIIINYLINEHPMGSSFTAIAPLNHSLSVLSPSPIDSITVIKGTKIPDNTNVSLYKSSVFNTYTPHSCYFQKHFQDNDFDYSVFYYLRVRLADGNMAWTSPIWVNRENVFPTK